MFLSPYNPTGNVSAEQKLQNVVCNFVEDIPLLLLKLQTHQFIKYTSKYMRTYFL